MSAWIAVIFLGLGPGDPAAIEPVVEVEETVYGYTDAKNGAGPMWCSGSTCLVRTGGRLFASGIETIAGVGPLNNCRWILFERRDGGWERVRVDDAGRTREPSPLAAFADGRVFLSANPTLRTAPEPGGGPARPVLFQFRAGKPAAAPAQLSPGWSGEPKFTEHSYRSLAADGPRGELILFQNIGYTHAEWAFLDREGKWSAQGQLKWPWGAEYDEPEPVRVCYPCVALRDRAVHFFGVSDVVEPYKAWRDYKRELTGQQWDYDFRRLFYTWTDDVTSKPFAGWVEIASRDKTCGWMAPNDLYLAPDGAVHLLWTERAIDERLRERFFPDAKQSHALVHAVVREGKVVHRESLLETNEGSPGVTGSAGRFHVTPEGRLFVVHLAAGSGEDGRPVRENRIVEVGVDGPIGSPVRIPSAKPFTSAFTTTVRAGSAPSGTLELLGVRDGEPNTISYARIRLSAEKSRPDAVVFRGRYPGWPWIARTPSGRLVCVWREGERHMFSAEGKLMIGTSDDMGRTWSEPRTFQDEPGIDDRNVAVLTLSDTDWIVAYNTYTGDNRSRVHTLRTRDGGESWSRPQLISDMDARTRSAPIQLSGGELVLPFYREPNIQSYAAISKDDGASWSLVAIENHEGFLGDEWSVCELTDGRLVGIIRNSAPGNDGTLYKTESRDSGRSWSRPARTNLRDGRSTSPAQIFVHGGRPVVLYADARMVSVAMAVTDDPALLRWDVDRRLPCYRYREDGQPIADGSYPVSAALGGNRRFIVDYEHDGDEHLITGYEVELPESWLGPGSNPGATASP